MHFEFFARMEHIEIENMGFVMSRSVEFYLFMRSWISDVTVLPSTTFRVSLLKNLLLTFTVIITEEFRVSDPSLGLLVSATLQDG